MGVLGRVVSTDGSDKGGRFCRMRASYVYQQHVDMILAALMPANSLAIRVAVHTGLRIDDVLSLRTDDLAPQFWITEHKTGKRKLVGLPQPLLGELQAQAGEHWVFEGRCDPLKHRTRQAVWKDVKRAARLYRIPDNVTPHSFRKHYAVDLLERCGDLDRVRRALNHESDTVTMIYAMANYQMGQKKGRKARKHGKKV